MAHVTAWAYIRLRDDNKQGYIVSILILYIDFCIPLVNRDDISIVWEYIQTYTTDHVKILSIFKIRKENAFLVHLKSLYTF